GIRDKLVTGVQTCALPIYFVHPASVAGIIAELRLDTASICAGLLHDVVEDTLRTLDDVNDEFGDEVAFLVDGVTKLSKINFTSRSEERRVGKECNTRR